MVAWKVLLPFRPVYCPVPCPLVIAIEARRRVYFPLPHQKRFVVVLVGHDNIAMGVALAIDEVRSPQKRPTTIHGEPLPSVIEERPFIHILREYMAFFHLMNR